MKEVIMELFSGTQETTKYLSRVNRYLSRDTNQTFPAYETTVLQLEQHAKYYTTIL
jgi:hypothetical protein